MMTVLPTLTRSLTRAASQFASRMQPWLAARPIVSGFFVIDENLASRERRIFRNFPLCELFDLKWQDIGHLENFARLQMLPIFSGIELLDERLGGMIALGDESQQ